MSAKRPDFRIVIASSVVAVLGVALTAAGLAGTTRMASAGDFDPSPQSTQTVPTQFVPTQQPTQILETVVPTTVATSVATEVPPTTVPTGIPSTAVPTSTSQITVVTATSTTVVQTQGGGVATQVPLQQTAPTQNVAGVSALPSTGAAGSSGGSGWLFVAAGLSLALAGFAGIVYARRSV